MSNMPMWSEPRGSTRFLWVIPLVFVAIVIGLVLFWVVAVTTGIIAYAAFAHPGWFFFPFGFLLFLLFVFVLARVAWWGVGGWGWGRRRWHHDYYAPDPHDVVRMRYARGEITREQYTQMVRDLGEPEAPLPH